MSFENYKIKTRKPYSPTDPSFFPVGSSNSTPTQSPSFPFRRKKIIHDFKMKMKKRKTGKENLDFSNKAANPSLLSIVHCHTIPDLKTICVGATWPGTARHSRWRTELRHSLSERKIVMIK